MKMLNKILDSYSKLNNKIYFYVSKHRDNIKHIFKILIYMLEITFSCFQIIFISIILFYIISVTTQLLKAFVIIIWIDLMIKISCFIYERMDFIYNFSLK